MKKLAALLACFAIAGSAQASIVSYNFTATVNFAFQADINYHNGVFSDEVTIQGSTIQKGETVHGSLTFDTTAPLWFYPQRDPALAMYRDNGTVRISFQNGLSYQSSLAAGSQMGVGHHSVIYDGMDAFWLASDTNMLDPNHRLSLELFDGTGTALGGTGIPALLPDLSHFDQKDIRFDYQDGVTRTEVTSTLTSLTLVSSVPEPQTYAMLLAGLGLMGWRRRRALRA